jgi:hypothetical protein
MAQHQRKNAGEQVITANRLVDGVVVYWAERSWSEQLSQARVLPAGETKGVLEKVEQASVVDIYFFEIEKGQGGAIIPISERERIRAKGPTVRLDLGKQAEAEN